MAWLLAIAGGFSACSTGPGGSSSPGRAGGLDRGSVSMLFGRWLSDAGGREAIHAVKNIKTTASVTVPGDPETKMTLQAIQMADGRCWYEISRPNGDVLDQAFDGRQVWRRSSRYGVGLGAPDERNALMMLDDLPAEERVAVPAHGWHQLAEVKLPSGLLLHVVEAGDRSGGRTKWFFGLLSGRLEAISRIAANHQNETLLVLSNFAPVMRMSILPRLASDPGRIITVPMVLTRIEGGSRMVISKKSVTLDAPVDDKIFTPPPGLVAEARATDEILARYLQAGGGAEALGRIRTRITKEVTAITTNGMKLETTVYQKAPNRILTVTQVPGVGIEREGFDGRVGWAESEIQGTRRLQGAELAQLMKLADLRPALHLPEEFPLRRLLPDQELGGRRVRVVRMATLNAEAGTCYFDAASGQLVRSDSSVTIGAHGKLKVVTEFSDFRTVDGVTIPFVTVITNPAVRLVATIQSVENNVPIDDRLFRQPADD